MGGADMDFPERLNTIWKLNKLPDLDHNTVLFEKKNQQKTRSHAFQNYLYHYLPKSRHLDNICNNSKPYDVIS